jgi:ribonucleoside-diphosphate reductase beta chain
MVLTRTATASAVSQGTDVGERSATANRYTHYAVPRCHLHATDLSGEDAMSTTEQVLDLTAEELRLEAIKEAQEAVAHGEQRSILDPGFDLTLRPMRYPAFFEMYRNAIKNTWTVAEIDFSDDLVDLQRRLLPSERHLVNRIVAFFATGDTIVSNNLVLNLYKHVNSPEARMYLSRQLFEEAQHIEFYLTLLDNYVPDHDERQEAFAAIDNIPSIKMKADFYFKWMHSIHELDELKTKDDRRRFLLNVICFAACVEGLSFYAAFAYVYFLRSKGLLNGLADGTNWVFRDESCHMNFAFAVMDTVRAEEPDLFDDELAEQVYAMIQEAVDCEIAFAEDVLGEGVPGLSTRDMKDYLEYVADQRLMNVGLEKRYNTKNPLKFMELQDVEGLSNFFERTVSSYQTAIEGEVGFDEDF